MKYIYFLLLIIITQISIADESSSKVNEAIKYGKELCHGLNLFKLDMRRYPTNREGLLKLIDPKINDYGSAGEPYFIQIESDPWGNQYKYLFDGVTKRVWSIGPDGLSDNTDDVGPNICTL